MTDSEIIDLNYFQNFIIIYQHTKSLRLTINEMTMFHPPPPFNSSCYLFVNGEHGLGTRPKVHFKYTDPYYRNAYNAKTFHPNHLNFWLNEQNLIPKILANFGRLKVKICENMAKNSTHFEKKFRFFFDFFLEWRL